MPGLRFMLFGLVFILTITGFARAGKPSGEDILKKVDDASSSPTGGRQTAQLEIKEPGKEARTIKFKSATKGTRLIRIDFQSPGNVKGMRFLALSPSQMYAYVPAQRKVRRLGSHVMAMGLMGSAFSHKEMSLITYGSLYTAKLDSQDAKTWTLHLTARPDSEAPYPRLELVVQKDNAVVAKIRYFNEKGIQIKVEHRKDAQCYGSKCIAKHLTMESSVTPGQISVLRILEWEHDAKIKDSFFTVQAMRRTR